MEDNKDYASERAGKAETGKNGLHTIGKRPGKRQLSVLFAVIFLLSMLAALFFLLRSFPLEANGFAALHNRPALLPTVRMEVNPRSAYHLGVAELDPGTEQVKGTMLLYEMGGGEALVLVEIETLEEMSSSPEPILIRGVISPLSDNVKTQIQNVIQKYYDLSDAEAAQRLEGMVYIDARWQAVSRYFPAMFIAAGIAVAALIATVIVSTRKGEKNSVSR